MNNGEDFRKLNPFCTVFWNDKFIGETATQWGTVNPLWGKKKNFGLQRFFLPTPKMEKNEIDLNSSSHSYSKDSAEDSLGTFSGGSEEHSSARVRDEDSILSCELRIHVHGRVLKSWAKVPKGPFLDGGLGVNSDGKDIEKISKTVSNKSMLESSLKLGNSAITDASVDGGIIKNIPKNILSKPSEYSMVDDDDDCIEVEVEIGCVTLSGSDLFNFLHNSKAPTSWFQILVKKSETEILEKKLKISSDEMKNRANQIKMKKNQINHPITKQLSTTKSNFLSSNSYSKKQKKSPKTTNFFFMKKTGLSNSQRKSENHSGENSRRSHRTNDRTGKNRRCLVGNIAVNMFSVYCYITSIYLPFLCYLQLFMSMCSLSNSHSTTSICALISFIDDSPLTTVIRR